MYSETQDDTFRLYHLFSPYSLRKTRYEWVQFGRSELSPELLVFFLTLGLFSEFLSSVGRLHISQGS